MDIILTHHFVVYISQKLSHYIDRVYTETDILIDNTEKEGETK